MTRTVLRGGQVFDGSGDAPFSADVVIEADRIADVGVGVSADRNIDVSGMTVAPGLIDCHAHVMFDGMDISRLEREPFSFQFYVAQRNLSLLLDTGFTTVRDAGGADLGVKRAVQLGLIEGPQMVISITPLSQTGGHLDGWSPHGDDIRLLVPHPGRPPAVVDGVDAMRVRVRELIRAGADVIKVCASGGVISPADEPSHAQFSLEELEVCVSEAHAAGRSVLAHAHSTEGIKRAIMAGVRSIEHGVYLDDECIQLFLDTGTWLVPTLLAPVALLEEIDAGMRVDAEVERKARAVVTAHHAGANAAVRAGVRIALGTDSGLYPHGSSPRELAQLVRVGMSPYQALHSATASAADLLGLNDRGRVAPGLRADLIVLGGDPWDFSCYRENLRLVIAGGEIVRDYTMANDPAYAKTTRVNHG